MIRFLESRQLIGGGTVQAGEERTLDPAEEEAFVANGVAEFVTPKTTAKAPVKEEAVTNG